MMGLARRSLRPLIAGAAGVAAAFVTAFATATPADAGYGGGYGGTSGSAIWALTWWGGNPQGPGPYMGPPSGAVDVCSWHDVGDLAGLNAGLSESSLPLTFWTTSNSGGHPGIWGIDQWAEAKARDTTPGAHFDLVACPNPDQVPPSGADVESSLPLAHPPHHAPLYLWIFWDTVEDPPPGSLPPLVGEAFDQTNLPSPIPSTSPDRIGSVLHATVVNVPTWLWVSASTWHTYSAQAAGGGLVATVWATPIGLQWTAGWNFPVPADDPEGGTTLGPEWLDQACAGPGTPYRDWMPTSSQSTQCSFVFRQSSFGTWQSVRATVTWQVHWALENSAGVVGGEGTLPDVTTSAAVPLRVMQVESVISRG